MTPPFVASMRGYCQITVTLSQSIVLLVSTYILSVQVACNAFDSLGHVEVKHFDEISIHQDSIEDEEWFTRYHFSYDAKRVTVSAYFSLLVLTPRIHAWPCI